jgi:ATP-dependent helicase/nuclease subunit A
VFPPHDDLRAGAVAFSPSVAARAPAVIPPAADGVTLRVFPEDDQAEADWIAARIAQLRAVDAGASVAVLVVAHAHALPIVRALAARAVPALGVDLVPLAERPVVGDLVHLTRALHDLADRTAWLAVLRAPWCGASLNTLTVLSRAGDPALVWEALNDPEYLSHCAPAEQASLGRVREVLTAALTRRDRQGLVDWIESTWVQLGAADAYSGEDLADARAFLDALALRVAAGDWTGPRDLEELLAGLHSAAGPRAGNPVQIMTIHRAKGLQFDHVFVPALASTLGSGHHSLLRWIDLPREEGGSDLLMAPAPRTASTEKTELAGFIDKLSAVRTEHERRRLLYVAATRARYSLHLSAAPERLADGTLQPKANTLLACLWQVLKEDFVIEEGADGEGKSAGQPLMLRRLRGGWLAPQLPLAPALVHLPLERGSLEVPEFKWVQETTRSIGTLVHEELARFAQAAALPEAHELAQAHAALESELRRAGVPAPERAAATAQVLAALTRTLADERGRWILDRGHREAHSELALTGLSQGRLRSVVIDRSFVDEAGVRWVIDYKTSRHEGGGLEAFIDQEIERYRAQLETYRDLSAALGPEPVRAALYFPLLGVFREL